ncbi:MAG: lysophospholipase [Candidatus Omnitrophica bacterium]|nr:lysophospholipase [Candidatus Omnitrophota bacterium]
MRTVEIRTRDGQRIALNHYDARGGRTALILAHGFFNAKDAYLFRALAEELGTEYDCVVFDFRGHGKSSGLFSWTARERFDLRAAVDYTQGCGYLSIGLIGFSLGAAVGILETAENPAINSLISVSAPSDIYKIDYHFWKKGMWEDLKLNVGCKGKGKGIRPGNPFLAKVPPVQVVARIAPRPVLFIHGEDDWLINVRHSRWLFARAAEPKKLVIIEGGGHAEKLFDDQHDLFMRVCREWLAGVFL